MRFLALTLIPKSLGTLKKDKVILICTLIPMIIGLVLFYFLGSSVYSFATLKGNEIIQTYLKNNAWGEFIYYILITVLTVLMYFIINWTFVLLLSILASPFNDIISKRVETISKNEPLESLAQTFKGFFSKLLFTFFTEMKKLSLIFLLTIFSMLFSYIPFLTPISLVLTALLLGISYLDFNWSRHEYTFKECKADIRRNLVPYSFGGIFFLVLVSIPLVNLLVPAWATCYFSFLWIERNENSNKITK